MSYVTDFFAALGALSKGRVDRLEALVGYMNELTTTADQVGDVWEKLSSEIGEKGMSLVQDSVPASWRSSWSDTERRPPAFRANAMPISRLRALRDGIEVVARNHPKLPVPSVLQAIDLILAKRSDITIHMERLVGAARAKDEASFWEEHREISDAVLKIRTEAAKLYARALELKTSG